jgi:hypothetical protein
MVRFSKPEYPILVEQNDLAEEDDCPMSSFDNDNDDDDIDDEYDD